jgi:hypothetical protein
MTIINALNFFESLLSKTNKKSEIKVYKDFITILSNLKNRELTENQIRSIEKELDILELKMDPKNKKRFYSKKLIDFKNYLKKELSLITEGYYAAIGIGVGMSFGIAIGASFGESTGIAIGISLGMAFGLIIGRNMDAQAEKQNRVLKTK